MIMYEYQLSVSIKGKFVFRTDWDTNKERIKLANTLLEEGLPKGGKITLHRRSLCTEEIFMEML